MVSVYKISTSTLEAYTDQLRSNIGKQSVGHSAPEAEEDRKMIIVDLAQQVMTHRTIGVFPVTETNAIMLGVTT
jgi:hypothetical protein